MSRIMIEGGRPLCGELTIQGSKNAALPILAATVLVEGESVLIGCPEITDVQETIHLLQQLGCRIGKKSDVIRIDASELCSYEVTDKAACNSRICMMLLGALIGRMRRAMVCYPGGCTIGCRPVDLHLSALRQMGVVISETSECIQCEVNEIQSTVISFPIVSVGATESVILASVLSEGTVRIKNAACEPEICHLCDFLRACGACIYGDGTRDIIINGVKMLTPCKYIIPSDRIACGTYLLAAAATAGNVVLHNAKAGELQTVLSVLSECGCEVQSYDGCIRLIAPKRITAIPYIQTETYPGFPTDLQSLLTAVLCTANGTSMVRETIFEGRFQVIPELRRMGAVVEISGDVVVIEGKIRLSGKDVTARELRGSAALIIAGLAAEGVTSVDTDRYLKRGYQDIVKDLQQLGAVMWTVS